MFSNNENKTNQTKKSIEYWKSKFPQCFEKTLRIQLNRIEMKSNKKESDVTKEKMNLKSIDRVNSVRITRNSRKQNFIVDWVRISNGIYKGDIAKLESFNECQSEARLKVFPRINYDSFVTTQRTKRRPPLKAFDPSAIRYDKMQIIL